MKQKIPAGFLFAWFLTAAVLLGSVIPVKALNMPVCQIPYYRTEGIRQDNNTGRTASEVKLSDNDLHALSAILLDGKMAGYCMIKLVKRFGQMPVQRRF